MFRSGRVTSPLYPDDGGREVGISAADEEQLDLFAPEPTARQPVVPMSSPELADAAPDGSRGRRVRALLCTEPLHDLQSSRNMRGGIFPLLNCYDLALSAIDFVVDAMGFDTGADPAAVADFLFAEVHRAAPDAADDEVEAAARVINETLIRPQRGAYNDDETRRPFDFQLLREEPAPDGVRVAATNEAINVLVGALDTDIASAHSAADAKVASLVARKRFPEAQVAAREARIRSIQYTAEVRRLIADTRLDVRRAGWGETVPDRLDEIVVILTERMHVESRMLEAMRSHRDEADNPELASTAAQLVNVVEDCLDRHRELHNRVMEATETFFVEQERQGFQTQASLHAVDPYDQLLAPVFAGTVGEMAAAIEAFASISWGVRDLRIASMERLLEALLADPREVDAFGGVLPDEDFDEVDDPRHFPRAAWEAVEAAMRDVSEPLRLSELAAAVEAAAGPAAAELVVYEAYRHLDPRLEEIRRGRDVLAAADDGATLDSDLFVGTDLIVGRLVPDLERTET